MPEIWNTFVYKRTETNLRTITVMQPTKQRGPETILLTKTPIGQPIKSTIYSTGSNSSELLMLENNYTTIKTAKLRNREMATPLNHLTMPFTGAMHAWLLGSEINEQSEYYREILSCTSTAPIGIQVWRLACRTFTLHEYHYHIITLVVNIFTKR